MDLEQKSIERLRVASKISLRHYDKPLLLTYSGGKDSDVILELAIRSGIPFEVINSHTTADAPETVYYIRNKFKELELKGIKCEINKPQYQGKSISMWSLIPIKLMPPNRMVRYCCEVLKENTGDGRMIATGVRWAESNSRKNGRGINEALHTNKEKQIILTNDNDDKRQLIERCEIRAKTTCNPIVDWTDNDVWDYIHSENIKVNKLYECGFDRVGCIGCPLASKKKREFEFAKYPKYKNLYISAFDRMLLMRHEKEKPTEWITGRDVFSWWMMYDQVPGQMEIEDYLIE